MPPLFPSSYRFGTQRLHRLYYFFLPYQWQLAHQLEWGFHMARVNCLSWAPDSQHLASGSLDTAIIIWDVKTPTKHITYKSKFASFIRVFVVH